MAIYYPLFLVALIFLSSVYADVNWSIDCGTSDSSSDSNSITWTGDNDTVISTGQPKSVPTSYLYSSSDPSSFVVNTLRAFPSGTTNCYVLEGEKGAKVQLRAMFYYGNYDGESAPPTFGLQFDGNDWATVQTTMDINSYLYYDVIYVTKGDNINVCLIQTNPSQIPFISAIQVRTLKPAMYKLADSGNALFLVSRLTLSAESIRYPTDDYDRFWSTVSVNAGSSFSRLTYDGLSIDVSTSPEEPPQDALKNALTTSSTTVGTLKWTLPDLPGTPISVYLKLYFSEMTDLASTQKRAFSVSIGGTLLNSTVGLVPPYGGVTELTVSDITMSNATEISLVPTKDSTESPLVNAMEVFQVSDYKVTYTAATPSSPSPPESSSGDTPPPSSSSDDTPPSPSGNDTPPSSSSDDTPPASFSSGDESGSSSGKKKSKLPLIIGAGVPVFILFTAFLVVVGLMHQKRKRAAIMGAGAAGGGGGNNGQLPYNNGQNQMMNDAGKFGQGVAMNEFTVNVEDNNNGDHDMVDRAYASPAPLLNNYHD